MSQTGLVGYPMALLGGVAVREPERGAVSVHHVPDHRGRPGRRGVVHHRLGRAEHPMVGVCALDPDAGFVRGDHLGLAQGRNSAPLTVLTTPLCAPQQVHQAALAEMQPDTSRDLALTYKRAGSVPIPLVTAVGPCPFSSL